MNKYIVVVGNFGAGQEIIMRFLNRKFKRLKIIKEHFHLPGNNFLSQMDILGKIFKSVDSHNRFYKNQTFIMDNHPIFMQNCALPSLHSMEKLTTKEVQTFREWVRLVNTQIETRLVIYLKLNTNKCYERLLNENKIEIDYETLLENNRQLTFWMENSITEPNVTIDMNYFLELEFDERKEKELVRHLMRHVPFFEEFL